MTDEFDNLDLDLDSENINRTEQRIKSLSTKVRETASERDAAKEEATKAESLRVTAERERDFYSGLTDVLPKYAAASEHKDEIKEKVLAGYSLEDATVSVLNAHGKLTPQVEQVNAPQQQAQPAAAGGSAPTNLPAGGSSDKSIGEMTPEERKVAFQEAVARGDIALT